jgi:hypothetical protein
LPPLTLGIFNPSGVLSLLRYIQGFFKISLFFVNLL